MERRKGPAKGAPVRRPPRRWTPSEWATVIAAVGTVITALSTVLNLLMQ